ncbi:MAG: DUF1294 domain-containing protein [Thermoanaerobacterales bacterium]|nr:DUF1294 domain-containing protein [Thermoanaerobacterales bacterium]
MANYKIVIVIILSLNLVGFLLIGLDKYKSKRNKWRIKEITFFIFAALGGSVGVLAGRYFFRHKTKHPSFVFGLPLIIVLQLILIIYLSS